MGTDKVELCVNGQSFLTRIAETLSRVFSDVMIIGLDDAHRLPVATRVVADIYPGSGPLGGIHAALMHAQGDAVFVTACDTPRITAGTVTAFLGLWRGAGILVARDRMHLHPLFGIYTREFLPDMETALQHNILGMRRFLHDIGADSVDICEFNAGEKPDLLMNVNTPEDYARLLKDLRDCE